MEEGVTRREHPPPTRQPWLRNLTGIQHSGMAQYTQTPQGLRHTIHPSWKVPRHSQASALPKKTAARLVLAQTQARGSAGKLKTFTQLGLGPASLQSLSGFCWSPDWGWEVLLKGPVFPPARPGMAGQTENMRREARGLEPGELGFYPPQGHCHQAYLTWNNPRSGS